MTVLDVRSGVSHGRFLKVHLEAETSRITRQVGTA